MSGADKEPRPPGPAWPLPLPWPLPLSLEVSQRAFDGAGVHRLSIRLTSAASQNGCFLPSVLKADSAVRPLFGDNIGAFCNRQRDRMLC